MDLLRYFEKQQTAAIERPALQPGDIVRVQTKIQEGDKARLQIFEGTVIGVRGSGPSTSFTVRREVARFGVERVFPLYSPLITNIEIVKRQKVRRAKLNYLREAGKRRFKEDVLAMQRHVREESEKRRLEEEAKQREEAETKKAEDAKRKEEEAKTKAEADASAEAADQSQDASTSKEAMDEPQDAAKTPEAAADTPPADEKK